MPADHSVPTSHHHSPCVSMSPSVCSTAVQILTLLYFIPQINRQFSFFISLDNFSFDSTEVQAESKFYSFVQKTTNRYNWGLWSPAGLKKFFLHKLFHHEAENGAFLQLLSKCKLYEHYLLHTSEHTMQCIIIHYLPFNIQIIHTPIMLCSLQAPPD